jgi:hypothetical protein
MLAEQVGSIGDHTFRAERVAARTLDHAVLQRH